MGTGRQLETEKEDTDDDADSGGLGAPSPPTGTSGSSRGTAAPRAPASSAQSKTEIVQVSTLPITSAIKRSSVPTSARMPTTTTTSARTRAPTATTRVRTTTATTTKTIKSTTTKGTTTKSTTTKSTTTKGTTTKSTTIKSTTTRGTTTTSTTTKSTTTATTTKSTTTTPSTTTKYTPPAPPVTNKPLSYSFICTVDCIKTIFLPEDGLCDFMFFESLYRICGGDIGETQLSSALTRFVMRAKTGKKTQYGVSIYTPMIQDFMKHLANQQSLAWVDKELWKNNVYHWGIMTIHEFHLRANSDVLMDALAALKAAALFSKPSSTKTTPSYTFIGFFDARKSCDIIGKYAKSLFTPDAMVVLGHIAFEENKIPGFSLPCFVIPPNCIEPPASFRLGRKYSHTVEDAAFQVPCLRKKYNITVPISLSVTLQGRWYEPKNFVDDKQSTGKYVYTECNVKTFTQEDDPLEICDRPGVVFGNNIKFDQKAQSVVYFDDNPNNRSTFIFDNSDSLRYKVCAMKRRTVKVTHSIAAYDVNFDSGPTSCNESLVQGKYARTRQLKRLLPFIEYNYTEPQKLAACRKVT